MTEPCLKLKYASSFTKNTTNSEGETPKKVAYKFQRLKVDFHSFTNLIKSDLQGYQIGAKTHSRQRILLNDLFKI